MILEICCLRVNVPFCVSLFSFLQAFDLAFTCLISDFNKIFGHFAFVVTLCFLIVLQVGKSLFELQLYRAPS